MDDDDGDGCWVDGYLQIEGGSEAETVGGTRTNCDFD